MFAGTLELQNSGSPEDLFSGPPPSRFILKRSGRLKDTFQDKCSARLEERWLFLFTTREEAFGLKGILT
jgi:hypothetical protein